MTLYRRKYNGRDIFTIWRPIDLEIKPITQASGVCINNKGQIVGYGDYIEEDDIEHDGTHRYAFLMSPIKNTSTLSADINDDGIVNFFDQAELANQWLEREDWYEE